MRFRNRVIFGNCRCKVEKKIIVLINIYLAHSSTLYHSLSLCYSTINTREVAIQSTCTTCSSVFFINKKKQLNKIRKNQNNNRLLKFNKVEHFSENFRILYFSDFSGNFRKFRKIQYPEKYPFYSKKKVDV